MSNPYQVWVVGMTLSIPPMVQYLPENNENIVKGDLCIADVGFVKKATQANSAKLAPLIAIESVDNSGGAAGDKNIGVIGGGQIGTVSTTDALNPYDYVKVSATTAKVMKFVTAVDDPDLIVGMYVGIEGAIFARAATTPFAETLSAGDKPLRAAVANDVVAIKLMDRT